MGDTVSELDALGFTSAIKKIEDREGIAKAGVTERPLNIKVWFVPVAEKDELASKREGRTIYKESVYLGRRNVGDRDYVTQPASPELIAEYPQEWADFQNKIRNPRTSILHLPMIEMHPAIRMYCEDARIGSIEALAEAPNVQPELKAAQELARRWIAMVHTPVELTTQAKNKGGRPKGSKNKAHVEDTQAAA